MNKLSCIIHKHPLAFAFVRAFFSIWALTLSFGLSTRNLLIPVLFVILCRFFHADMTSCQDRHSPVPHILSLLFTLLCLLAEHTQITAGLDNRLFQMIVSAAAAFGLFFLFDHFLTLLLSRAAACTLSEEAVPIRRLPLLGFAACMLGWLPYFLYEYPGIMTPDSINQLEQVLGMIPYSNHHPWAHTMTMKLFYCLGSLFTDNRNLALAFFTLFQMGFMAFCTAFLLDTLQKLRISNVICLLILAFYALTPYHGVFAVTLWKDIMFSGAMLLFVSALVRFLTIDHSGLECHRQKTVHSFPWLTSVIYTLSGIMICLYRTNGWYAFLLSLPFLLFALRRSIRIMLPLHLAILTTVLIVKLPVMNAFQVTQPDLTESLCIPIQQVARVICEDKSLTQDEWDSIHQVIDTTYIKELYAPGFADNMKELVRAGHPEYLEQHKGEYLRLWLSLGLRYPSVYLQAYIDQTIGYWYPDVEYTVGDIDGIIPSETGVYSHPLLRGHLVVKTKEIMLKLGDILPLYGLLSSMGAMFWMLLICICITIMKKDYNCLISYLPQAAVILTLLAATPVSSEFRYAYSLAYTLPLYLVLPFYKPKGLYQ